MVPKQEAQELLDKAAKEKRLARAFGEQGDQQAASRFSSRAVATAAPAEARVAQLTVQPQFLSPETLNAIADDRELVVARLRAQAQEAKDRLSAGRAAAVAQNKKVPNKFEPGSDLDDIRFRSTKTADAIEKGTGPLTSAERISIGRARFPDKKSSEIKSKFLPRGDPQRARAEDGLRRKADIERQRDQEGFSGSLNELAQKNRAVEKSAQKNIAVEQRERFVASGQSQKATAEQVAQARLNQIKKGNIGLTNPVTGKDAGVVGNLAFAVRQAPAQPRGVPNFETGIIKNQRSGRSALVFAGESPGSAAEAFQRLDAPQVVSTRIDFGRQKKTVFKRAGLFPEISISREGEEISRRSVITEKILNVPNRATAQFAGLPTEEGGQPVSFPAQFRVAQMDSQDFERETVFTPVSRKLEQFDAKAVELSEKAVELSDFRVLNAPVPGNPILAIRGIRTVGKGLEKAGTAIEDANLPLKLNVVGSDQIVERQGFLNPVGQFIAEEGRIAQERPVTFGAGEAFALGYGFGFILKGAKLLKVSRAAQSGTRIGNLLRAGATTTEVGVTAAGVGLTGLFVVQTVSAAKASERPGVVVAQATNQAIGFGAGVGLAGAALSPRSAKDIKLADAPVTETVTRVPRLKVEKIPNPAIQRALNLPETPAGRVFGSLSLRGADRFGVVFRVPEVAPRAPNSFAARKIPEGKPAPKFPSLKLPDVPAFGLPRVVGRAVRKGAEGGKVAGEALLTAKNLGPSRVGRLVDSGIDAVTPSPFGLPRVVGRAVRKGAEGGKVAGEALLTAKNLGPSRVGNLITKSTRLDAGPFSGVSFFPEGFFPQLTAPKFPSLKLPDVPAFGLPRVVGRAVRKGAEGGKVAGEALLTAKNLGPSRVGRLVDSGIDAVTPSPFGLPRVVGRAVRSVVRTGEAASVLVSRASFATRLAGQKVAAVKIPKGPFSGVSFFPEGFFPKVKAPELPSLSGFVVPQELVVNLKSPFFGRLVSGRVNRGVPEGFGERVNEFNDPVKIPDVAEPIGEGGLVTVLKPSEQSSAVKAGKRSSGSFGALSGNLRSPSGFDSSEVIVSESLEPVRELPERETAGFFAPRSFFASKLNSSAVDIGIRLNSKSRSSSRSDFREALDNVQASRLKDALDIGSRSREKSVVKEKVRRSVALVPRSDLGITQRLRSQLDSVATLKLGGSLLPNSDSPGGPGGPGFQVLIRRRGAFVKATNRVLTRDQALEFGATFADNSPTQSFKLLETDQEAGSSGKKTNPVALKSLLSKFTKKKGGIFREKQKNLIDSAGEVRDISLKGVRASAQSRKQLSRLGI